MNASSLISLLVGSSWLLTPALPPAVPAGGRPSAAPATKNAQSVTVVVSALVSTQATVWLNFYNSREGFLKRGQQTLQRAVRPEGRTVITVPIELTQGEWAVALTQDLNNNDKLDKNFIGIPTEPYAFSNNVRPTMGPPNFDECKFMVGAAQPQVVSIVLKK